MKRFFFVLCFCFISGSLYSFSGFEVSIGFNSVIAKDFYAPGGIASANWYKNPFVLKGSFFGNKENIAVLGEGEWKAFSMKHFSFSLLASANYSYLNLATHTNAFKTGVRTLFFINSSNTQNLEKYLKTHVFSIQLDFGYLHTSMYFPQLPKPYCFVNDSSIFMALFFEGSFYIPNPLTVKVGVQSCEDFRYPVFFIPTWFLSLRYFITPELYCTISSKARYSDMFTLTAFCMEHSITASVGYLFSME